MKLLKKKKTLIALTVTTGALLVALIVGNQVTNYYEGAINSLLNASTSKIIQKPNAEKTDTEYYKSNYAYTKDGEKKLVEDGKNLYRQIVEEGTTLLMNTGKGLPFSNDTKKVTIYGNALTPFNMVCSVVAKLK